MNRPVRKLLHKKPSKEAVKSPFLFSVSVPSASQYSMRLIHYRVEAVTQYTIGVDFLYHFTIATSLMSLRQF